MVSSIYWINVNEKKTGGAVVKVAGIIAEYNPFHQGHRYHIEETRRKTGAEYVVVVMSGDYVQRGEPAVTDKYMRTRMALLGGADVVLEIPVVYATASAEYFATAGVKLLDQLGCVDVLSFGSEWATVDMYRPFVNILTEEPEEYCNFLKQRLQSGCSYPEARSRALIDLWNVPKVNTPGRFRGVSCQDMGSNLERFLKEPNHILGLEYMKCLQRIGSGMESVAIRRRGSAYHDNSMQGTFSSATAIRGCLRGMQQDAETEEKKQSLAQALGENVGDLLFYIKKGETVSWDDLKPVLDYLMVMQPQLTEHTFGMEKELTFRMQKMYSQEASFEELVVKMHAKNRTDTALKRALLHMILQIGDWDFLKTAAEIPVPYARVLGFRKNAAPLLKAMRANAGIPVIQRPVQGQQMFADGTQEKMLFQTDLRASNLYESIAARKAGRPFVDERMYHQIIVES